MVQKRSIMYYQQQDSHPFLKIVVALPTMVASCRGKSFRFINIHNIHIVSWISWCAAMFPSCGLCLIMVSILWSGILDRGIQIDGLGMKSFMTYESNVLFALRFMIDCNIVGGNWIEVPAGKYKTAKHSSYCQLEFHCLYPCAWKSLFMDWWTIQWMSFAYWTISYLVDLSLTNHFLRYADLISHAPEGEFSKMAPFRILSFDIECAGRKGHFPEPTHDPVIQVQSFSICVSEIK